jgi:hypothetical protein
MKIIKYSIIIFSLLLIFPAITLACQPCQKELNFSETVGKADLMIVGQKKSEGPSTASDNFAGGPERTKIKVLEVLKGNTDKNEIQVRSWYGMCAYGIILKDDNQYVIFLEKGKDMYYAVNGGCALRTLKISGESVYYKENDNDQNTQKITIDELVKKIGPDGKRQKVAENTTKTISPSIILYIIGIVLLVLAAWIAIIIYIFRGIKNKKIN